MDFTKRRKKKLKSSNLDGDGEEETESLGFIEGTAKLVRWHSQIKTVKKKNSDSYFKLAVCFLFCFFLLETDNGDWSVKRKWLFR